MSVLIFNVEEEEEEVEQKLNKIERDIPILIDEQEQRAAENREKRKLKRRPASLPMVQVSNREPVHIELSSLKKQQHNRKMNEIKTIPDHIFFDENDLILNKNESKLINLISDLGDEMKLIINGKINNCIKNSKVRCKITSFMILKNDDDDDDNTTREATHEATQTFNFIDEYDTYDIKSLTDPIVISNEQFSTDLSDFETELIYIVSIFNYLQNKNPPITYIISKKLIETSIPSSSPITTITTTTTTVNSKSLNFFDKLKLYFSNINTSTEMKSGYHYSIDIDLSLSNPKKCKK